MTSSLEPARAGEGGPGCEGDTCLANGGDLSRRHAPFVEPEVHELIPRCFTEGVDFVHLIYDVHPVVSYLKQVNIDVFTGKSSNMD